MENIITALFEVESEGFQAITQLKQTPAMKDNYAVLQAALIKRDGNNIIVCDSFDSGFNTADNTLVGGLVGSVIGVLGGPPGVLLMGTTGALMGSSVDSADALMDMSLIEKVAEKIGDKTTALIALVAEGNEACLDTLLSNFKTVIIRFDAAHVAKEVDEALFVQNELIHQAQLDLRKEIRETQKAEYEKEIAERRAKIADGYTDFMKQYFD